MTTPAAPPISISQMRTEFGLGLPVSMSQLLGKGGAPASAPLKFSDMLGRSAPPPVTFSVPPGSYTATATNADAQYTLTASQAVVWTWTKRAGSLGGTATPATGGTASSFVATQVCPGIATTRGNTFDVVASLGGVTLGTWVITVSATNTTGTPPGGGGG